MNAGLRAPRTQRALRSYCARADWPSACAHDELLATANIGLLLRWEAALTQMRAFRALPDEIIARSLQAFSRAVAERLQREPVFSPLEVRPLDRAALHSSTRWDRCQTIFPFMLRHPQTGQYLTVSEVTRVWQL